jgi:hypothetical protein
MKITAYASTAVWIALAAACSGSGHLGEPTADGGEGTADAAPPAVDSGTLQDAAPEDDLDAERPLVCGDAGFCETRLPLSDLGTPLSLRRVWAVGPKDVWSLTFDGYVLHYDGVAWAIEYRANHELYAVWATATSVWVGGEAGLLLRRNSAGKWTRYEPGHVAPIRDISGTADDDVWFPNPNSSVDHFDGTTLTNHAIDVPGLEITTVFGRPGVDAYAAGYVKGELAVEDMVDWQTYVIPDQPYLFKLSTTNITIFNASLSERRGFAPVSGLVSDAPDDSRRVLLTESQRTAIRYFGAVHEFDVGKRALVGPESAVEIDTRDGLNVDVPALMYGWSDIRFMFLIGKIVCFDVAEGEVTNTSLAMGYDFPNRNIFGAHIQSPDVWVVGDGFALKGTTR